jgi:hypothetical protein
MLILHPHGVQRASIGVPESSFLGKEKTLGRSDTLVLSISTRQ